MWDLIVSVPDHCLSFYFPLLCHIHKPSLKNMLVCCLPSHNFQAGSVGRKEIVLLRPRKRHYFRAKLFINRSKSVYVCMCVCVCFFFFFKNDQKHYLIGGKMMSPSVNSKPKYFSGWPKIQLCYLIFLIFPPITSM